MTRIQKKYIAFLAIIQIFPVIAVPVMTDQMREEAYAASVIGANLCYLKKGRLDEKTFVLNVEKVIKDKGYSLKVLNKDEVQEVGKLVAKKLGDADAVLYATREYIERIGNPTTPQELQCAHFVNLDHGGMFIKGLNMLGLGLTEENFPLLTESYVVMWELVRQGVAIGILDAYIGDADPVVQRVLPDLEPLIFPIWLVSHRELKTSRRIRRVFDFLAEELHRG